MKNDEAKKKQINTIKKLEDLGYYQFQIAEALGITRTTLFTFKNGNSKLSKDAQRRIILIDLIFEKTNVKPVEEMPSLRNLIDIKQVVLLIENRSSKIKDLIFFIPVVTSLLKKFALLNKEGSVEVINAFKKLISEVSMSNLIILKNEIDLNLNKRLEEINNSIKLFLDSHFTTKDFRSYRLDEDYLVITLSGDNEYFISDDEFELYLDLNTKEFLFKDLGCDDIQQIEEEGYISFELTVPLSMHGLIDRLRILFSRHDTLLN
jgi:hypothetical protein